MAMAINKVSWSEIWELTPGSRSAQLGAERGEFLAGDDRAFHGSERYQAAAYRMASRGRIRTACGYVPTVLEQRPSGLHRGSAHYPPVRSEGRKRQTLPD